MSGETRPPAPPIALAKPCFDARELELLRAVLESRWVSQGPRVQEFEERFAERVGAQHAVATSSCTSALFLALHALGIGRGDEVVVPSLSFIASANAVLHCGAEPVFADVARATYNLDPAQVEAAIGPRTRAVLVVHQVGLPAELAQIEEIVCRRGLALVEDAACAIGSRHPGPGGAPGAPVGSSRSLACFSFHPRKVVVTGEGGMLTTPDAALAARLRRLRHQGMDVSDLERHRAATPLTESYPELGYNFRMSDLHAALGVAQLEKLDWMLERRREVAERYHEAFRDHALIEPPAAPGGATPNHQSYLIRLRDARREQRDGVIALLAAEGIASRRGLMAAHREAPHANARRCGALPNTEAATDQTLAIPIHPELRDADQARVIDALERAAKASLARGRR